MSINKINHYFKLVLELSDKYYHSIDVVQREFIIRNVINMLISNNEEHLLTESLLDFMVYDIKSLRDFDSLRVNDYHRYALLNYYFRSIKSDYISLEKHQIYDVHKFTKSMDSDTFEAFKFYKWIEINLKRKHKYTFPETGIINFFFLSLLSHCFINNIMNEYENMAKPLLDNLDELLDYFKNNGIEDFDEDIHRLEYQYSLFNYYLEKKYKKSIN